MISSVDKGSIEQNIVNTRLLFVSRAWKEM